MRVISHNSNTRIQDMTQYHVNVSSTRNILFPISFHAQASQKEIIECRNRYERQYNLCKRTVSANVNAALNVIIYQIFL